MRCAMDKFIPISRHSYPHWQYFESEGVLNYLRVLLSYLTLFLYLYVLKIMKVIAISHYIIHIVMDITSCFDSILV